MSNDILNIGASRASNSLRVNVKGAEKAAMKLHSYEIKEQIAEIGGCSSSSKDGVSIDFPTVEMIPYIQITNNDSGLTDKDISNLTELFSNETRDKGHSCWGLGLRSNGKRMTEYFKSSRPEFETVSFYIFDKLRGIMFNVKSDNSDNDFYILNKEDTTKLYNIFPSVIDSSVENNTKIIVPFDLDSQVGYASNRSGLLKSLKEDIESRWNLKLNDGYKLYFNNEPLKINNCYWPNKLKISISNAKYTGVCRTLYIVGEDWYFHDNVGAKLSCIIPEDEKDYITFTQPNKYEFDLFTNLDNNKQDIRQQLPTQFRNGVYAASDQVLITTHPVYTPKNDQRLNDNYITSVINIDGKNKFELFKTNPVKANKPKLIDPLIRFLRWFNNQTIIKRKQYSESNSQDLPNSEKIIVNNQLSELNSACSNVIINKNTNASCISSDSDCESTNDTNISVSIYDSNSESKSSDSDTDLCERNDFSTKDRKRKLSEQHCSCADITKGSGGISIDDLKKFAPDFVCPLNGSKFPQVCGDFIYEADHIIPRCKGGKGTYDNCQILCHMCHAVKTKIESLR